MPRSLLLSFQKSDRVGPWWCRSQSSLSLGRPAGRSDTIRAAGSGAVRLALALVFAAACAAQVGGEEAGSGSTGMGKITGTVVVPAYKENLNIRPLAQRLFAALKEHGLDGETELVIVDDNSRDGSEETVEQLRKVALPTSRASR